MGSRCFHRPYQHHCLLYLDTGPVQISQRYIAINLVWDRIEKILFALVDLGLNLYFLYIVKSQLISCGLDKYKALFNFNVGMVFISISMDVSTPSYSLIYNNIVFTGTTHRSIGSPNPVLVRGIPF